MRRILLTGLFLLLPAAAHAQAQGGPAAPPPDANAPKPAETAPAPADKPVAAPPAVPDAKPVEPSAPHEEKSVNLGINPTGPSGPLGTSSLEQDKPTHA